MILVIRLIHLRIDNKMGLTKEEKIIVKILTGDDIYAKRQLLSALIFNEKIKIIQQIREKWGDEHFNEIVEIC